MDRWSDHVLAYHLEGLRFYPAYLVWFVKVHTKPLEVVPNIPCCGG